MRIFKFAVVVLSVVCFAGSVWAWDADEVKEMEPKVKITIDTAIKKDPGIKKFFDKSSGFAVFPTVGKGGLGIGGAHGNGLVQVNGKTVAQTSLTQITIGFQAGGQAYSEFVFFKDKTALDDFLRGNFEFGAQVSAVAITAGASADANYNGGVAVFTIEKGGLMYEASVGGQNFKVEKKP